MAMKYIKLFESWLLEAEEMAINNKFSASQPQKTPVLLTTIEDFNTVKDEQLIRFFEKLFKRAKQEEGAEKFNPNPESAKDLKVELIEPLELEEEYASNIFGADKEYNVIDPKDRDDNIERIANHFKISEKDAQILMERIIINLYPDKVKGYFNQKDKEGKRKFPANDTRMFLKQKQTFTAAYKIVDPKAGCDVYFGPNRLSPKTYGAGNGIIEKGLGFIFCIKDGKLIFDNYNQCNMGQLLAFIQKNMSPDDTDILDADGNARYLEYCAKLFGNESEGSSALVAKWFPTKVGEKTLQLISDETPVEKGGKGVIMPLIIGVDKVIGTCGFDFDKATLKEDSKTTLSSPDLWKILTNAQTSIEIEGHTDGKGSATYNMKLSDDRAKSVLAFFKGLPEFEKIKPSVKITTVGKGKSQMVQPDDDGKNQEAAAKNRRVVIRIDGQGPDYDKIFK